MKREIIITEDGSHTISVPELKVSYHSIHGAVQESKHVFIEAGLHFIINNSINQPINIFEMGLGTGLNVFLTAIEAEKFHRKIYYVAVEQFPVSLEEAMQLNYPETLGRKNVFQKIHECNWNEDVNISEYFTLRKENISLINYSTNQPFNLIYYDAFAPAAQPELWTKDIFEKLFTMLQPNGVIVTYCSKGDVRRAMIASGFKVQKLKGPPGKREMLRGTSPRPSPTKLEREKAPIRLPPMGGSHQHTWPTYLTIHSFS